MGGCRNVFLTALVGVCWIMGGVSQAKVHHKVKCTDDTMVVELVKTDDMSDIYLWQLQHYPDPACHPEIEGNKATFKLHLDDFFQCGVTKVTNKVTGRRVFYHRIVVESEAEKAKQVLLVKCVLSDHQQHAVAKRNVLPAGFTEPEDLEITPLEPFRAPEPVLGVGVRQGGQLVTGELNVNPGTPLEMEIFLDNSSAPVYGLLVSYMQVTDTKAQQEVIIFNGCSVDPYLFENFNTVDGDFLKAKFRAFKFPESTYVQFKGTVNVCLDKCRGVDCSNGQTGYGRRKREVPSIPPDPNKIFEVSLTTFIKVDYKDEKLLEKAKLDFMMPLEGKNASEVSSADLNNHVHDRQQNNHLKLETEEIREELEYTVVENGVATPAALSVSLLLGALLALALFH